jgi:uncharacterized protein (DUF2345 family)
VQLKGGNIIFGSPGEQSFKGQWFADSGPTSMKVEHPKFASSEICIECLLNALKSSSTFAKT